jgi:hypothetical protein
MSASYLLDENPTEDNALTEVDLQRGSEDDAEPSIVHSLEEEYEYDEGFRNSKPINDRPPEYAFVSFPSSARFVAINPPSLVHRPTPRILLLPCAAATRGKVHNPTNLTEVRSLVLAASESIDKSSSKKTMAVTAPAAPAIRRKRDTENIKKHTVITIPEDHVDRQAQTRKDSAVAGTRDSPLRTTPSATVLAKLSETTLNKLHTFKFIPPVDCAAPPAKIVDHRPERNSLVSEDLTYLQPDVPRASNDDDEGDEFDLDENIFDNIYADDDAEYRTPDSTLLSINDSCIDPCPADPEPRQATPTQVPPPHPSPRHFKSPPKPNKIPPVRMSPFLRSSFPKPVPSPSILPSLVPQRRIPTLFRIAEVHRLLATLSPRVPPQRIELYATVVSSRRDFHTKTQEFTFADLFFPHRPPYLCGTYTAWKLGELFEEDSAPFLENVGGCKLCRAIVQVKRNGNARQGRSSPIPLPGGSQGGGREADALDSEVLNIWEATWEDVEYVKRIVGA